MTKENPWVFYPAKDIKHPDYQVAFLMSPHISYPTKIGNSIATLVDTIATKINYQTIVFVRTIITKPEIPGRETMVWR